MIINSFVNKKYNNMLYDTKPVKFSDFISNKYNIVHKKLYNLALSKYIKEWIEVKKALEENYILSEYLENNNDHFESAFDDEYKVKEEKYMHNQSFINKSIDDKKYIDKTKDKFIYDAKNYDDFVANAIIIEIPDKEYWQPSKCMIITKFISVQSPALKWEVDLTKYWNYYQRKKDKEIENVKLSQENILDSEIIDLNYVKGKAKLYSETLDEEYELDFDYLNGDTNKISDDYLLSKNTFISNKF